LGVFARHRKSARIAAEAARWQSKKKPTVAATKALPAFVVDLSGKAGEEAALASLGAKRFLAATGKMR
jgi:hypothetical protein